METNNTLKNQSGTALVAALIMIVVLTLIGLASVFSSTFEISLSGNNRLSTDAFYNAESRMYSAARRAEAIIDQEKTTGNPTLINSDITADETNSGLKDGSGNSIVSRRKVYDSTQLNGQFPLPSGTLLNDKSKVTIYHCWAAGGGGEGRTVQADSYIVDAEGTDQIASSDQNKSRVHVRIKVRKYRPTVDESQ